MVEKNKPLSKFQKIAIYFVIYAFIGWICEEIYCIISTHEFIKRGFLFGPICPIYGYGAVLLLIATKKLYKKPFLKFLIAITGFTVFEYIVSLVLEMLFYTRL